MSASQDTATPMTRIIARKFSVREKNQRIGRNPRNGEEAVIKERRVVIFKPSKIFREQVMEEDEISE